MRILTKLCAALFMFAAGQASAATVKTIYRFCPTFTCDDGAQPLGPVSVDEAGNLYGTASTGGPWNVGVVFELVANADRTAWTYKVLHRFCEDVANCTGGEQPSGGLLRGMDGSLYGSTQYGGSGSNRGLVFQLKPNADRSRWRYFVLHTFCADTCDDGAYGGAMTYEGAESGALYDGQSPLYGTSGGGPNNLGVVFALSPHGGSWRYKIVHAFSDAESVNPSGAPSFSNGSLYGLTVGAADSDSGALYRLTRAPNGNWRFRQLYAFEYGATAPGGNFPVGPLIRDAAGAFYGTAVLGGEHRGGVLFSLAVGETGTTEQTLYSFCADDDQCKDGYEARSGVVMGADGALYGTTPQGGDSDFTFSGGGTIFEYRDGKMKQLYAFCAQQGCHDGYYPNGLTPDGQGHFFGTTSQGGRETYGGTVFELIP